MTNEDNTVTGSVTMDLRGRQSVRATFKLSEKAIESLSLVAVHLGIKQKSLFDHLVDDAEALSNIAEKIRIRQFNQIERVQKTYVLSRKTLDLLEMIAKDNNTPRDALVEYALKRLEDVILAEKEKHKKRKTLLKELDSQWKNAITLFEKSRKELGEEDPFCRSLEKTMNAMSKTKNELKTFIEKSSIIETY
ncbi:conserved hypothetical protein [Desulfamplus magnetovallimortis]|uniref:Uncharacterized protein n=1 Tax=Desulfamplus magnetovallimortis TaxID=1246637 RepID=A0A1W1HIC2_9BACT|nr:hypothetical protein [Desulfamplus magnetovallimortis]SLM32132.1 conserved hypothetical protein [Desulfamplus magnetovallimortis]